MANLRIAGQTATRRYVNNLHSNFFRKNESENKIITNRKYTRASQSPLDAAKALKVRKAISEVETYQRNLETAKGIYESAESAVRQVSSIMQTLQQELIRGAHGTYALHPDKQIIGETIETLGDQMVRLMNLVSADRRIFGGVNNSDQPPFKIENDTVYFNGVNVNLYSDPNMFPDSRVSYLDAGLGLAWENEYTIDSQTAIPVTFNGAAILGSGMDENAVTLYRFSIPDDGTAPYTLDLTFNGTSHTVEFDGTFANLQANLPSGIILTELGSGGFSLRASDNKSGLLVESSDLTVTSTTIGGFPRNIIQLTLDAAASVRAGTDDLTALYADLIFAAGSTLSLAIANIGSEQAFIEFNQERLTGNMYSLLEQQNLLEHPDLGSEITNQKVLEMIYNATLQMSASTIPMSIFNFMR
ncbi:MAG: hypothetical protein FWG83_03920 [Oscillospiraceae bacterium]|nr:hypothetical protein [Oscillospiraceae bacterium]